MDYTVLIAGAGPAGISTWLHLHQYAPEIAGNAIAIDKAIFPRNKVCGGGVGSWSADILRHLHVNIDIPSLFVSDVEFRFGKETYHFHKDSLFRMVRRIDFDHALVKHALNRGLKLLEGEKLLDLSRDQRKLIVITNKNTYRVNILIGSDGALSKIRQKAMPFYKPQFAPTIQVRALSDSQGVTAFNNRKITLNLSPIKEGLQGYIWHVPCLRKDGFAMVHGICDFRIHCNQPRADMKKIFIRELRDWNVSEKFNSWESHPIHWLSNYDVLSQPNILLVGDAAGIEPAFGGGIHMALAYGKIAAQAIKDAVQRNDFSFNSYGKMIHSSIIGEWTNECTRQAKKMYAGRINPLLIARELFHERDVSSEYLSQMASEVARSLRSSLHGR